MDGAHSETKLVYQTGFANHFATEAWPGALPQGQNSPQRVAHGLYAEQLSGTAFTAPRSHNLRSWLYRLRPSADHPRYVAASFATIHTAPIASPPPFNRLRWNPIELPGAPTDFLQGLVTIAATGDARTQNGCAAHLYAANQSMREVFFNADGEMLFVPQQGVLTLFTELGKLSVGPGDIAVVPRGVRFRVEVEGAVRGYVCENYGAPFRLPELGPIGANGLANPRDFETPVAAFEDHQTPTTLVAKFAGQFFRCELDHSPLDVVAWHGNYAPYKYDLTRFNAVNTVTFDHPDPSIFTVLTSPSEIAGTANVDFVIFPPRWMVAEHTFRPPWYHRNVMSELMGLVHGVYDAKAEGFAPGGISLHNCMTSHGPDRVTFEKASSAELKPAQLKDTLAFMFEARFVFSVTDTAMQMSTLQSDYDDCWKGLARNS